MLYLLRHSFQNNSFPWWWFLSLNFLWGKEWTFLTNYCTWCIIYSSNCITWVCVCSVAQLCPTLSTLRIIAFLENLKDIVKVHNVSLSKGLQSPGSDRSESVMNMSFKLTSLLTINRGKSSNIKKGFYVGIWQKDLKRPMSQGQLSSESVAWIGIWKELTGWITVRKAMKSVLV